MLTYDWEDAVLWVDSLEVGDIINAKDDTNKWYESMVRYKDGRKIYIHYIGWNLKFDTIYNCNEEKDLLGLSGRDTQCLRAHIPQKLAPRSYMPRKMMQTFGDKLTISWRS